MIEALVKRKQKYLNKMAIRCLLIAIIMIPLLAISISIVYGDETIRSNGDNFIPIFLFSVTFFSSLIFALIFKLKSTKNVAKRIEAFCEETDNPKQTFAHLEKAWNHGETCKLGKMSRDFIFLLIKGDIYIIDVKQVIWIYGHLTSMNFIRYNVSLHVKNKYRKDQLLNLAWFSKKSLNQIETFVFENCPHIVVGVNDEINQMVFNRDLEALLQYAHKQRNTLDFQNNLR